MIDLTIPLYAIMIVELMAIAVFNVIVYFALRGVFRLGSALWIAWQRKKAFRMLTEANSNAA